MQGVFAWREMAAPGAERERNRAYLLALSDRVELGKQAPRALNVCVPHWKLCAGRISFFVLELPKVRQPDYPVIIIFPHVLEHVLALPVPARWILCCRGPLAYPPLRP